VDGSGATLAVPHRTGQPGSSAFSDLGVRPARLQEVRREGRGLRNAEPVFGIRISLVALAVFARRKVISSCRKML
jgi:hypothetical protein